MEVVLHQINVYAKLDGVVQIVINVHMDIIQMVVEVVYNVVIVVIMEHVQMDQLEQVYVHVILVIGHLVQLFAPVVLLITFHISLHWVHLSHLKPLKPLKHYNVPNVMKPVKLVNPIQLIALRTFFPLFSFVNKNFKFFFK